MREFDLCSDVSLHGGHGLAKVWDGLDLDYVMAGADLDKPG